MPFRTAKKPRILFNSVCALTLASLVNFQPTPVQAGDGLKTLAIGAGIVVIANELAKSKKNKKKTSKKKSSKKKKSVATGPRATIGTFNTTRSEVADYQTRLNSLGFQTGTPDGVVGGNTRKGVRAFQASIGSETTGRLTESEASHLKAITGAPTNAGNGANTQMAMGAGTTQQPANAFMSETPNSGSNQLVVDSAIPLLPSMQNANAQQQTSLVAPSGGSTVTLEVFSLDNEPTNLGLKHNPGNFDILQVRTGDSLDAAKYMLSSQGVSQCVTAGQITTCSMDENPNDQIAIRALPDALGVARITTLARHIHFPTLQPEPHILSLLPAQYDPLVKVADKVIGTEGCHTAVGPAGFSGEKIYEASVHSGPAELTALAANCVSFARLSMTGPEQGLVSNLYIVLFDGSELPKQKPTKGLAKIKF